jgi:hypothetical protein
MKRIFVVATLFALFAVPAFGQRKPTKGMGNNAAVKSALVALEKQAWEAWKKKDANFFRTYLADDAIGNGREGVENRTHIIDFIANNKCEIRSYMLDDSSFNVTMIDADAAILTYKATQDYTCDGKPGPTPIWSSAVYVKRGGKWLNVFYQESQAEQ